MCKPTWLIFLQVYYIYYNGGILKGLGIKRLKTQLLQYIVRRIFPVMILSSLVSYCQTYTPVYRAKGSTGNRAVTTFPLHVHYMQHVFLSETRKVIKLELVHRPPTDRKAMYTVFTPRCSPSVRSFFFFPVFQQVVLEFDPMLRVPQLSSCTLLLSDNIGHV